MTNKIVTHFGMHLEKSNKLGRRLVINMGKKALAGHTGDHQSVEQHAHSR
jgi:hypothetical protein